MRLDGSDFEEAFKGGLKGEKFKDDSKMKLGALSMTCIVSFE